MNNFAQNLRIKLDWYRASRSPFVQINLFTGEFCFNSNSKTVRILILAYEFKLKWKAKIQFGRGFYFSERYFQYSRSKTFFFHGDYCFIQSTAIYSDDKQSFLWRFRNCQKLNFCKNQKQCRLVLYESLSSLRILLDCCCCI